MSNAIQQKQFNPKDVVLDEYEQSLEEAFERGEFVRVDNFEERKEMWEQAARQHCKEQENPEPVTLRLNQGDLTRVKARAKRNRIPYQTLLSTLIHQFAEEEIELRI